MNRLAGQASLYLRQHAENPVDWYPWGEEALERARAEDRPVLLSVGYSSCHWCHVMAHESFEDPETAAVMNELFVNVKVDREERPDLDALYMQATMSLSGSGGWPMTVFLTPDGRPFYAGTYFPSTARGGLPGFADLCRAIAAAYRDRREDVEHQAAEVARRLGALSARSAGQDLGPQILDDAVVGLARVFDPHDGGFGTAPKFPPPLALEFLLRRLWRRPDDPHAREMVELTLARMAAGGIHDQVGGGFHRYSVDGRWLVPHFEKMLYDNALLAGTYALAHRVTGAAAHRAVAESTLDYMLRELRLPGGGFGSAQDADSPGGEGAFFTWTPAELQQVLPPEQARAVALRHGVTAEGNFEGRSILHVAAPLEAVSQALGQDAEPLLAQALPALYAARSRRPAPARDDKLVAAWNGLAVAALADAGILFGRPDYIDAAEATAAVMLEVLTIDGRLRRVPPPNDGAAPLGQLDDHADLAHGLLALYAATFAPRWLRAARDVADRMVELFADPDGDGFFYTATDGESLLARTREVEDHPTPAGNSQAAHVLLRLADLTGDMALADRAAAALAVVGSDLARFPQAFGTALVALDHHLSERREIAVVGALDDPRTAALVAAARAGMGPFDALAAGDPADAEALDAVPLLRDRPLVRGAPAAYVCVGFACRAPVTGPEALAALLAERRA